MTARTSNDTFAVMRRAILLLLLATLSACASRSERLPAGAVVLTGKEVPNLLQQCSRAAPAAGEATWQPDASDIATLEAMLPAALASQKVVDRPAWNHLQQDWSRQYGGIIRKGRRYIYGNYFPADETREDPDWTTQAFGVCDGGPAFFGVEFDVAAHRFTQIDFNGLA